jgi:hypothetical protein
VRVLDDLDQQAVILDEAAADGVAHGRKIGHGGSGACTEAFEP